MMKQWAKAWGFTTFADYTISPIGYIVESIAVAFLYKTDCGVCHFENVMANPVSTHEERMEAFALIDAALVKEAKQSGYKMIFGETDNASLIETTKSLGYKIKPNFTLLIKEII